MNLIRGLLGRGVSVVSVSRSRPSADFLRSLTKVEERNLRSVTCDVRDGESVAALFRGVRPDVVIHAAAITPLTIDAERVSIRDALCVNIGGTGNVLEAAKSSGVRRFVYVSSGNVYGSRRSLRPLTETSAVHPTGTYGITKLAGEQLALRYGHIRDMSTVSVRIQAPYGPWEEVRGTRLNVSPIPGWCLAVLTGVSVNEALDIPRDFTFIDDTVDGITEIALRSNLEYSIYNLSSGVIQWYSDVLASLGSMSPDFRYAIGPRTYNSQPGREVRGPLATQRIKNELGWAPSTTLESGLRRTMDWVHRYAAETTR
jgi:nucleoside-diphosphate-sugar epimerase